MNIVFVMLQSKRLPNKDNKSSSPLSHSGFSQSLWIREMQQASNKSIIISEILDSRTRNLVSVTRISDYVLSNELVSMALAMVAEDKQINRVLEELFAEEVLFNITLTFLVPCLCLKEKSGPQFFSYLFSPIARSS